MSCIHSLKTDAVLKENNVNQLTIEVWRGNQVQWSEMGGGGGGDEEGV